jgi:hypothetical protein
MYRLFLLLVDLAVLGFIIIMTIKETPKSGEDIAAVSAIYVLVILNITYIFFSKTEKESWLTLYFKRKALEEKKKIQSLQND